MSTLHPPGWKLLQREHARNVDAATRLKLQLGTWSSRRLEQVPQGKGIDAECPALAEQHGPHHAARCRRRLGVGGEPAFWKFVRLAIVIAIDGEFRVTPVG